MGPSSNKSIRGGTSLLLFIVSIYALSRSSASSCANSAVCTNLTAALISALNITILFGWAAFGILGGLLISLASVIVVSWMDITAGLYGNSALAIILMITSFMGYKYIETTDRIKGIYMLKFENTEEKMNLLSNGVMEKKRGVSALENKLNRYSTLKEVIESLGALLSVDEISKKLIEHTLRVLAPDARALLFIVDTTKQELMLSASGGDLKVKTKTGDIFDRWVLTHRASLIVEDVTMDFRFSADESESSKEVFRSLIAVPLLREDKVIGILRMDRLNARAFTQDDLRLLGIIADLGAVAIQNAMLYRRTQELAITDGLTGLFVRRHFLERFKEELKRTARNKASMAFLMLDIDHFKDYNDKYGHTAGDLVLKYLAGVISSMVREGDMVVRYGGEEIGILLCGRTAKEAHLEAERIRKEIEKKPIILRRHSADITASIGLAAYPADAAIEEELIRIADERLYKAKKNGRNMVCAS